MLWLGIDLKITIIKECFRLWLKLQKKEYLKLKSEIESKIDYVKSELKRLAAEHKDYKTITDEIGDYWNSLHDKQHDLEMELKFLDDRWDRRNWTASEHYQHDLIINNID